MFPINIYLSHISLIVVAFYINPVSYTHLDDSSKMNLQSVGKKKLYTIYYNKNCVVSQKIFYCIQRSHTYLYYFFT